MTTITRTHAVTNQHGDSTLRVWAEVSGVEINGILMFLGDSWELCGIEGGESLEPEFLAVQCRELASMATGLQRSDTGRWVRDPVSAATWNAARDAIGLPEYIAPARAAGPAHVPLED